MTRPAFCLNRLDLSGLTRSVWVCCCVCAAMPSESDSPTAVAKLYRERCFYRSEGWWTYELCVNKHGECAAQLALSSSVSLLSSSLLLEVSATACLSLPFAAFPRCWSPLFSASR